MTANRCSFPSRLVRMSLISCSNSLSLFLRACFFLRESIYDSVALKSLLTRVSSCFIEFSRSFTVFSTCMYLSLVFSRSMNSSSACVRSYSYLSSLASSLTERSLGAADRSYRRFSSRPGAVGWYSSCISCMIEKRSSSSRHSSMSR